MQYSIEFFKYLAVEIIVQMICASLVFVGYLIVLPRFWSKQTLGRLLSKTKVVMIDDKPLTLRASILREFIGSYLLYYCVGTISFIITIIFLNKEQCIQIFSGI